MTTATRHEIDAAILENDIDKLIDLLGEQELLSCRGDQDDDVRYLIHNAIDVVTARLERPIEVDVYEL